MSKKLDFKKINSLALAQAENVVSHYAPNGKLVNREWVAVNPNRNDSSAGSFSVNVDTGVWCDFATDDKGGDLVSYVAYVQRLTQGDAYKALAHFLGVSDEPLGDVQRTNTAKPTPPKVNKEPTFTPIYPPPPEAGKACPYSFPQFGKATQYWDYKNAAGVLLMRVCRFDRTTSSGERAKEYRPVVYGKGKAKNIDRTGWHFRQLPDSRPLYGLDIFASLPAAAPVVLVEGEKACDAARLLFPVRPCMTWSGGSKALSKTDFSPLAGRVVWYWPDNDQAGAKSVEALRAVLAAIGVIAFHVFDLTAFTRFAPGEAGQLIEGASEWPEKADAFDAAKLGWTAQHFAALELRGALLLSQEPKKQPAIPTPTPTAETPADETPRGAAFGFKVDDSGVWLYDPKAEKYRYVCARLDVDARSRDGNGSGQNWGLLVRFKDYDGVEKQWNIPMKLFAPDGGAEVVRGLLDRGLQINSQSRRQVLDYLQASQTGERVALAYKMGWHKDVFVMPDSTVGNTSERIIFYTEGAPLCKLSGRGFLQQWQEHVSRYCIANPLAVFAMSAAFSATLVELLGQETMGFHFYGDSSWGKSTLLNLACSVFGNPDDYKKTWRSTDNALEGVAAAHSDMLLALDEINQVDARIVGDVVYMLGNGQGKHRASDKGQARDSHHRWRFTFLSNGERTLEQYLAETGKTQTGGMEMRFIGIRATLHESERDTMRMGVFNEPHGFAGGAALSEHLKGTMAQ